jgi:hypothetical protein
MKITIEIAEHELQHATELIRTLRYNCMRYPRPFGLDGDLGLHVTLGRTASRRFTRTARTAASLLHNKRTTLSAMWAFAQGAVRAS